MKNKVNNNPSIEKEILLQEYSRNTSMAQTIFNTYFEIIGSIIFGNIAIILSLVSIKFIPFNKFIFINLLYINVILMLITSFFAYSNWIKTRIRRGNIRTKLKNLNLMT